MLLFFFPESGFQFGINLNKGDGCFFFSVMVAGWEGSCGGMEKRGNAFSGKPLVFSREALPLFLARGVLGRVSGSCLQRKGGRKREQVAGS